MELACQLVPHATETLAMKNPAGAKPALIELFESELPPTLEDDEFFPVTHRFVLQAESIFGSATTPQP